MGATDNDGRGTSKEGAEEIAANIEHLAQVDRAAHARLADAGYASPSSSGGTFSLTDIKSVTSDSASAALAVAPLLGKLKREKHIELLGEDACRRLAEQLEPGTLDAAVLTSLSVQSGVVRLRLRPFTLPPRAAPPPAAPLPAWHAPQPPACPDGVISAEYITQLGEWFFLGMSDDEKFSSSDVVQVNCLFHAAGHATEGMSNAIEEAVLRDVEREFPELKAGLYALYTNGQTYVPPTTGARAPPPAPCPAHQLTRFARARARFAQAPAKRPRSASPATTTTRTTRSTTSATRCPRREACSRRRTGPTTPTSTGS